MHTVEMDAVKFSMVGKKNQASFMFFSYPKCHQYHG